MLEARNISKTFPSQSGEGTIEVLRGVSAIFTEGCIHAIVGSSGSGKSTLLHILGGLETPTTGEVLFNGKNIAGFTPDELSAFRNAEIGFVFQFHHLLPEFTALENVIIPGIARKKYSRELGDRAEKLLVDFGLGSRLSHKPGKLSGGEQQRVAMARALINSPSLLLADEPTGNLDEVNTRQLMELITAINEEHNLTIVMVTHDGNLAAQCEHQISLKDGLSVS
ncbi:MAG: ABC-type lipoprotein export system ATPase component LolD [Bacteroidetes bacterium HLUCCA01]|nr:MAG: ABC-type lipoprotein export system ATPase component LolD [Bacteroidetes bacterium HLUCCA01]